MSTEEKEAERASVARFMRRVISLLRLFRKGGWHRVDAQSFRRETATGTQLLMLDIDGRFWVFFPRATTTSYYREEYAKLRTALNSINLGHPFHG